MKSSGYLVIAYGIFILIGGMMGYAKAHSQPSLIAGTIFAVLFLISGLSIAWHKPFGDYLALILMAALILFFSYRFYLTGKWMPPGVVGIITLIVFICYLILRGRGK